MKEFMLLFRMDQPTGNFQPSPEQLEESLKRWQDWIGGIAAQSHFSSTNRLGFEGKTLKPGGVVVDGPYAEIKEMVGGYIIIKSDSFEEALKHAEGCPIFDVGGNVEVREIIGMAD
jgi:hypothetical protein